MKETELIIEEYLLPTNSALTVCEKQKMFGIKTEWSISQQISQKLNIEYICFCGQKTDMKHVFLKFAKRLINPNKEYKPQYIVSQQSSCKINISDNMTLENDSPQKCSFAPN